MKPIIVPQKKSVKKNNYFSKQNKQTNKQTNKTNNNKQNKPNKQTNKQTNKQSVPGSPETFFKKKSAGSASEPFLGSCLT